MAEMTQADFEADPDDIEFDEPLDGSFLDVSHQEEVGSERYTCDICESTYSSKYNLKRHAKTHDERFTFECTKCTQYFTTDEALKAHQNAKHSGKSHLCTSCGKLFLKKAHLRDQQRRFHQPESLEPSIKCQFEGCSKSFQQKEKYYDHMNIHIGSKPYSCGKCAKTFHGKYYRNRHEKICTGTLKTECNICGQVLCDLCSLKRHKDAQHNKKVFTCHCGKMFARYRSTRKTSIKLRNKFMFTIKPGNNFDLFLLQPASID